MPWIKKPAETTIYRPARPESADDWLTWDRMGGFYVVSHGGEVPYAYFGCYYTVGEVISDVVARNEHDRMSLTGKWSSMDFVVWHDHRIMAVIHQRFDDEEGLFQVTRFDEEGNIPAGYFEPPAPEWPTREQWLADGG